MPVLGVKSGPRWRHVDGGLRVVHVGFDGGEMSVRCGGETRLQFNRTFLKLAPIERRYSWQQSHARQ